MKPTAETTSNITRWFITENKKKILHREDGPAFITDTFEEWYHHGKIHREDGPARVWKSGAKSWYHHGVLHRLDGPAVIINRKKIEWWLNGQRYRDISKFPLPLFLAYIKWMKDHE